MATGTHFYFDPSADGIAVFLGPTEATLMELAWKHHRLSVKKALYYLGPEEKPAYTTVMTVLGRLADKGLLVREKDGRNYIYRPALSRHEFIENRLKLVSRCLKRNFGKNLG